MVDIAIFSATQRSGSTLLQRLFNASPRNLVWGENGRVLNHFLMMHRESIRYGQSMAAARSYFFTHERPADLNISCMSPDETVVWQATLSAVQNFFASMYPPSPGMRIGFKEVMHPPAAVDLFRLSFPNALVVFLARHPISSWHSVPPDWDVSLDQFIAIWKDCVIGYPERGRLFWYEELLDDSTTQREICDLAGITEDQMRYVLSFRVGPSGHLSTRSTREIDRILDECSELIPSHVKEAVTSRQV